MMNSQAHVHYCGKAKLPTTKKAEKLLTPFVFLFSVTSVVLFLFFPFSFFVSVFSCFVILSTTIVHRYTIVVSKTCSIWQTSTNVK